MGQEAMSRFLRNKYMDITQIAVIINMMVMIAIHLKVERTGLQLDFAV